MPFSQSTQEVTLEQMLYAREKRACRQRELLVQYKKPLLCFTMNIAGPIKNSGLIRQGFLTGLQDITFQIKRTGAALLFREVINAPAGNEAYLVADTDAGTLKQLACEREDTDELGRLFDMDVITWSADSCYAAKKIDRRELGLPERKCLICGGPAKACASRRIHSVEELWDTTEKILRRSLDNRCSLKIAEYAVRSLLYEVSVTPKPGLVDRVNNGSHKDMDFYTFLDSAPALWPYFHICARLGLEYRDKPDKLPELFTAIRSHGKTAELWMYRSTGGINTHKGAVFTMGVLCAAAATSNWYDWRYPEKIFRTCAAMTKDLTARDFSGLTEDTARTVGQKLYLAHGITGVRGQMEEGLPAAALHGLPLLERLLAEGRTADEAGAAALLAILAHMTDTNLIARSDIATQQKAAKEAGRLLDQGRCPERQAIEAMDRVFIEKNLSPGGSADLLAVCWMIHFLKRDVYDMEPDTEMKPDMETAVMTATEKEVQDV